MAQWSKKDIPHKGWELVGFYDSKEDSEDYENCMMCGTRIRFVHLITHIEVADTYHVGCDCAESLTQDYVNPKRFENEFKQYKKALSKFLKLAFTRSKKGNSIFLNYRNACFIILELANGKFKGSIIIKDADSEKSYKGSKEFDERQALKKTMFHWYYQNHF